MGYAYGFSTGSIAENSPTGNKVQSHSQQCRDDRTCRQLLPTCLPVPLHSSNITASNSRGHSDISYNSRSISTILEKKDFFFFTECACSCIYPSLANRCTKNGVERIEGHNHSKPWRQQESHQKATFPSPDRCSYPIRGVHTAVYAACGSRRRTRIRMWSPTMPSHCRIQRMTAKKEAPHADALESCPIRAGRVSIA